ncbi:mitochondrial ribosomal subunit protein-domain-containing protein [Dendryphion nanum]|uniref:Mitochondrial ribosomal subunit protein-domain-containing protein n=1 Tax=Dendryphion nanum TaxID=256645 RepID=A0A9P9IXE1_9PLEO|nr:mitochondrial ribosomal subunit protein-domain-containing protein [Dendryphion nanum]
MASITRRLLLNPTKSPSRISVRRIAPTPLQCQRTLASTAPRLAGEERHEGPPKKKKDTNHYLSRKVNKRLEKKFAATAAEQVVQLRQQFENNDLDADVEALKTGKRAQSWMKEDHPLEKAEDFELEPDPKSDGFWSEGEPDIGPDEDYYGDDLTSLGHGELEKHREMREYARLVAWELPLLNQLARPFELPTAQSPFRFRYTSYLGEKHPATNKVVVEFCASDMPNLTQLQKDKLIKLAGVRYNPDTDIIKMSCEQFDTQAQNKRSLGETINSLLTEARDKKETFADVPFDFRHHKPKKFHHFPKEWIMTPERTKYLQEKRQAQLMADDERIQKGNLIDGQQTIDNALPFMTPEPVAVPISGPRGKALR